MGFEPANLGSANQVLDLHCTTIRVWHKTIACAGQKPCNRLYWQIVRLRTRLNVKTEKNFVVKQ